MVNKNMENNTITMARNLGKAIQADERYVAYYKAKELNDEDKGLQELIGEFNLIRQKLAMEAGKGDGEREQSKITQLNEQAMEAHSKIMDNPNMKLFSDAKIKMDNLISEVSNIISLSCDGEDPETCDISPASSCGGNCGGCSGCG